MFVLFMSHGLAYYIFPEQHYAASESAGWLAYFKYLCLLVAIPALVRYHFDVGAAIWVAIGVGFVAVPLVLQILWVSKGNLLLMQFQMAIFGYFFAPFLLRFFAKPFRAQRYLFAALIITFATTAGDLILGGAFENFSRSGFRSVGPFVNPNNTGIVVALIAVLYHHVAKGALRNLSAVLLAVATIAITGSKTSMAIYALGLLIKAPMSWRIFFLFVAPVALAINAEQMGDLWAALELREFSSESGEIRSDNIKTMLEIISNAPLFDLLFGLANPLLIDNAYLDMMSYGGLILTTLFLVVQIASILACVANKLWLQLLLHGLLFLAMLTTNVPRIWPVGYFYWALVSLTILHALRSRKVLIKSPT